MPVSAHFAASLALLLLAAVCYTVALATTSWSRSGEHVFLGIWQVCFRSELDGEWAYRCLPNTADFSMAGQAFSILAVLCYAVALLLYLAYIALPALHKSRPTTISLCLLAFFVVCLQIMTLVVFGVRMESYLRLVGAKHFHHELPPLTVAWSFIFAIISTVIATIAGICTFLELRNITLEDLLQ